jgi:hypothetical protein
MDERNEEQRYESAFPDEDGTGQLGDRAEEDRDDAGLDNAVENSEVRRTEDRDW